MQPKSDPTSIAGKAYPVEAHWPLVVIGAGPAGLAAAIAAAGHGMSVLLVDEHPVAAGLIGMDVPYTFGERMDAAVQNKPRMVERVVAARPELELAFERGVEVRLGSYVWGAFVSGPTSRSLPLPVLGLADDERSWLITFDRLIVATGARDLGLAFPGWELPGVVGVQAATAALDVYGAFSGRRIVVLGAGALAQSFAARAQAAGLQVAALVDVGRSEGPEPAALRGVPVHVAHRIHAVHGTLAVEGIAIAPLGAPEALRQIACDTIVCAVDVVPVVDVFDVLGCAMEWRPERGGYLPVLDQDGRATVAGVYAAGDCAGTADAAFADPALAAAAGSRVAGIAASDAGLAVPDLPQLPVLPLGPDRDAVRRDWLRAHATEERLVVCRCEEVTLGDLLGVRPPAYLSYDAARFAGRDLRTLAAEGPVNQDQVKRLTRAGMGACQGRRCREQVQMLLAMQGNQPTGAIRLASYRAPLRPLPLSVLTATDEPQAVRDGWSAWFGIPSMWTPHWAPHSGENVFLEARLGLAELSK